MPSACAHVPSACAHVPAACAHVPSACAHGSCIQSTQLSSHFTDWRLGKEITCLESQDHEKIKLILKQQHLTLFSNKAQFQALKTIPEMTEGGHEVTLSARAQL